MTFDSTQVTPSGRTCPTCGLVVDPTLSKCPRDGTSLVKAASPTVQDSNIIKATKEPNLQPIDRTKEFQHDPAFYGKYQFLGTIGAGGMGVIYKARQIIMDKMVAIKMVHSHLVSPEAFKRFQLEGKAAGLLSHPYIISVHDFDITESGTPYMIMDYVEGKTLSEILAKEFHLTVPRFLRIFIQVCDALSHAHHRNVLHRDIKPSNIMIVKHPAGHEEVRIMDFGIAKLLDDGESPNGQNLTKTGEAVGSPIYMSPEQARGSKIDSRTDLYSLGCVMYEALVGSPPFIGKTQLDTMLMHINEYAKPVRDSVPPGKKVDPDLENIVMKLLEKNPNARYQTMDDVQSDLIAVQSGKHPKHSGTTTKLMAVGGMGKLDAKSILAIAVCALGGIVVAFTGFFVYQLSANKPKPNPIKKEFDAFDRIPSEASAKETIANWLKEEQKSLDLKDCRTSVNADDLQVLNGPGKEFVTELNFSHGHSVPFTDKDIEPVANLVALRFANFDKNQLADLHALKGLKNINILSLRINSTLSPEGMKVISGMHNLVMLALDGTLITGADLANLYGLSSLRFLELNGCPRLTPQDINTLKTKLPKCTIFALPEPDNEPLSHRLLMVNDTTKFMTPEFDKNKPAILEAAQRYEQAANLMSESPRPDYYTLILLLQFEGDLYNKIDKQKAKQAYEQGLMVAQEHAPFNPFYPILLLDLAKCDMADGRVSDAIEKRTKASNFWHAQIIKEEKGETYKNFLNNMIENQNALCRYYGLEKNIPEAEKAYTRACAFMDAYGQNTGKYARLSAQTMGYAYQFSQKYSEAVNAYNKAFQNMPNVPPADLKSTEHELIRDLCSSMLYAKQYSELKQFIPEALRLTTDPKEKAQLQATLEAANKAKK